MELVYLRDTVERLAGIILEGDTVQVVGEIRNDAVYTVKEFDRFVAAYRKARREAAGVRVTGEG